MVMTIYADIVLKNSVSNYYQLKILGRGQYFGSYRKSGILVNILILLKSIVGFIYFIVR